MNCLKCGREVSGELAFCDECRLEMEKYPVKPGTPIQLPKHDTAAPKKQPKRKVISPEEQIRSLKKQLRIAAALLAVTTALLLALAYPAVKYLLEDHFLPGQNYTTIVNPSGNSTSAEP